MAGYGIPEADIASVLDIDPKTLRKHYRPGDHRQSVTTAIFWLKARAGWKEIPAGEPGGRDDPPTIIELTAPERKVL